MPTAAAHLRICMHMHEVSEMRTTIEMTDAQRARLLEIAATRGEKGFSHLVQEALDLYLREHDKIADRRKAADRLMGSWGTKEADAAVKEIRKVRAQWR